MDRKNLCGSTPDEILDLLQASACTRNNAVSILNSVYKKKNSDLSLILNIPGNVRKALAERSYSGLFYPVSSDVSADKTMKFLFRTETGKLFETVCIPDNKRNTVCVSTQSGCRMGCAFCITGRYGYHGNLSAGEILNQVISIPDAGSITHVVFMGMGEPLDNLDNVLKACEILTAEWGLAFSPRNITISTVGITPGVERILKDSNCNLTLSLHSPFTDERMEIIPAEKVFPVLKIIEIMKKYPLKKKRRLSIAYVMMKEKNDSERHLDGLIGLLRGSEIRVNLLAYHPLGNDSIASSSPERMQHFKHNLVMSGISASIRRSRGADISAACGLLAAGLKTDGSVLS